MEGHLLTAPANLQASVEQVHLTDDNEIGDNDATEIDVGENDDIEKLIRECEGNCLGKKFGTIDDAYHWYNQYALAKGFGTRVDYNRKSRKTNEIIRKRFVCNKEGFKRIRVPHDDRELKRHRDTRTGCGAFMEIKVTDSMDWMICKFDDTHNHQLTTPSKVGKHRSHRTFHRLDACKSLIGDLNCVGVRPCVISETVTVLTGSQELVVTPNQCSHYIRQERRFNVGRECFGIIKHFQEKAALDDSFFFAVDLDEEGILRNIFWADGRSRLAFTQFGDVVVFNVAYKTKKFKMPFAPFIGVNHHRQSILFGGALLVDETETTFTWLFDQFLKCMRNIAPIAIITDQDKAMGNSIKKVFPDSKHRFCASHINKHVVEHLAPYRAQFSNFTAKYKELVKSETIEVFEANWNTFKEEFKIEDDTWLAKMYDIRRHWVNAFLKDTFFAGMTSSGKSESIHTFFNGYLNSNTMLNEFVEKYDLAVKAQRDAENDEDFRTMNTKAVLSCGHPIEEQVGKCYTQALFKSFQKQWKKSVNLFHEKVCKEGTVVTYRVGVPVVDKEKWRIVTYQSFENTFKSTCSCAKFETEGILCKHILYILKRKCVMQLPKHYILDRWCIDARFKVSGIGSMAKGIQSSHFSIWSTHARVNKLLEDARCNPAFHKKFDNLVDGLLIEIAEYNRKNQVVEHVGCNQASSTRSDFLKEITICDPIGVVKTKGSPKIATRIKSALEISQNIKQKRTCDYCGEKGHYTTDCIKHKADEKLG